MPLRLISLAGFCLLLIYPLASQAQLPGAASVGMTYYAQWKVSSDDFGVTPPDAPFLGKHEVCGIGPEITLPLASKSKLYGFANFRYFWETGAISTLEGDGFLRTLTFPISGIPLQ